VLAAQVDYTANIGGFLTPGGQGVNLARPNFHMRQMAVFGLTSQNLAPSLRAKSNKSSRRCSSWVAQVAPCSHGVLWGLHFSRSRPGSRFPMRLQAGQGPRQKLATTSRICSECQQLILLNKIEFRQRCWSCKIIKT